MIGVELNKLQKFLQVDFSELSDEEIREQVKLNIESNFY